MLYTWIAVSLCMFWIHGQSTQHRSPSTGLVTDGSNTRTKRQYCSWDQYCGYEHPSGKTTDNQSLVPHYIYNYCNDSGKFSLNKKCKQGCHIGYSTFRSCAACVPGSHDCGYRLRERGYNKTLTNGEKVFNGSFYLCSSNGEDVTMVEVCFSACRFYCDIPSDNCIPGKEYCTDDLLEIDSQIDSNLPTKSIWLCTNDSTAVRTQECPYTCASDKNAPRCIAKCEPFRLYCGWELREFGWSGGDPNYLYQCTEQNGANLVTACGTRSKHADICRNQWNANSSCLEKCNPGQEYCGQDLAKLEGWAGRVTAEQQRHIQRCTNGTSIEQSHLCPDGCSSIRQTPLCMCKVDSEYCGHELEQLKGWESRVSPDQRQHLLVCTNGTGFQKAHVCDGGCERSGHGPYCSCEVDAMYCGHELERWPVSGQVIYICTNGSEVNQSHVCKYGCSRTNGQVHCLCKVGVEYCGFELLQLSWSKVQANSLYRCSAVNNITEIEACGKCRKGTSNSYCSIEECVDGSFYCGWQLQHSKFDLSFNASGIYGCQNSSLYTTGRQCLRHCVPATSTKSVYCSQECVPGQLYCGHQLHQLGFEDPVAQNLYRCSDGIAVALNKTCSGDCEVVDSDTFKCVSTPWYCDGVFEC